jgi:hypothetical protein
LPLATEWLFCKEDHNAAADLQASQRLPELGSMQYEQQSRLQTGIWPFKFAALLLLIDLQARRAGCSGSDQDPATLPAQLMPP